MRLCRLCESPVEPVIDLGLHPLADRFVPASATSEIDRRYPLIVDRCNRCHYVGLSHVVPEVERYQDGEYSYTSGNSPVSEAHFAELGAAIERLAVPGLVVDIGGNDGTLLGAIGRTERLNVEPSSAGALASARGIDTHRGFWDDAAVATVWARGRAAAIVMCNAFNHVSDPNAFVALVARALRPGGVFVIETPSLAELVRRGAWDTIYLEHVSYWSLASIVPLLARHGLHVFQANSVEYMGGSMRVWASKLPPSHSPFDLTTSIEREALAGYALRELGSTAMWQRDQLRRRLADIRADGGKIVAVGAAAKGNTLLNFCGIGPDLVECVLDTSPHKIGKFTPGSRLPIIDEANVPKGTTHALILPWNIATHLKAKLAHLDLEFVVP